MKTKGIILRRNPYEEPHHLNLTISASNGDSCGRLEYYCNAGDLQAMAKALKSFPRRVPDEYIYELGSPNPEDRCAYYLQLRAFTTDSLGHCALSITLNNNRRAPDAEMASFSVKTEAAALNRLGDLLATFGQLKHRELVWQSSGEGELNEKIRKQDGEQEGPPYGSPADGFAVR